MVNGSKEKEEVIFARNKIKQCQTTDDKEKQIDCIYDLLHDITQVQDITNLTIRKIIDNDEDPRWIPIHIVDNANAIILGISERKGNPKYLTKSGSYVDEKMNTLRDNWYMLRSKYER